MLRAIPKSRFRKNIKSYWCQELTTLKQLKVQAFRAWIAEGRPRDPTNYFFMANKLAKKNFRKRLKQVAKGYDEDKVKEAVTKAEIDQNCFWKLMKRERDGPRVKTPYPTVQREKHVHNGCE